VESSVKRGIICRMAEGRMKIFTPEQRLDAANVWVKRTGLDGKVTMSESEHNRMVNDYANAMLTSHFGLIITLQCELLQLQDKFDRS
jgi:hypothetical protein